MTSASASVRDGGVGADSRGVLPNAPHPLGIQPWGSLLLGKGGSERSYDEVGDGDDMSDVDVGDVGDGAKEASPPNKRRRRQRRANPRLGLGDLRRLPDEALLIVVASLPARDLAAVSCVSRALYAFASAAADGGVEDAVDDGPEDEERGEAEGRGRHDPPERNKRPGIGGWRSATLTDFGGSWAWGGTWARTYAAAAWARKELEGKEKEERARAAMTAEATVAEPAAAAIRRPSPSPSLVEAAERALSTPDLLPPLPPRLRVPLYSDALYATWAATAADPSPWLGRDTLPRVDASSMSPDEFSRRYDEPAVPVVLVGAARAWPAFERWKDIEYLDRALGGGDPSPPSLAEREGGGGREPPLGREAAPAAAVHVGGVEVAWRHFIEYAATNADDLPLTVFDSKVLSRNRQLRMDLEPGPPECFPVARGDSSDDDVGVGGVGVDDPAAPAAFDGEKKERAISRRRRRERDLFSVLPREHRPDHEWLIVGGRRSGSGFHIDPNATSAWNAVVCGSKKWVFYPPGGPPPPGVEPSADLSMVTAPAALADWFRGFYDEAFGDGGDGRRGGDVHRRPPSSPRHPLHRPLEGIVEAGDAVFVPRGWWHAVLNLETPTVAVTTNFVSRAGLPAALRWVRSGDASLVSGVRGDKARVELPERWERALREKCPEILEDAESKIAAEDAALEDRRRKERALASLFRATTAAAATGGGGEAKGDGRETKAVDAAPAAGGFAFNFAVED